MFEQARAKVLDALEAAAPDHDADIVSVEVVGTAKAPTVRVRVDHADASLPPISLEEVAAHNQWIGDALDALDPFPGSYTLEVSSPGLARPLRRVSDFQRFCGEVVQVALAPGEGRRKFTGTLAGIDGGVVTLACDDGTHELPFAEIASAKIKPTITFSPRDGEGQ